MIFSEKVKFVRAQLDLTQKELADVLEVSFATVNRWESKGITPQFLSENHFNQFCKENGIEFDFDSEK